jgi:hypothetical protein
MKVQGRERRKSWIAQKGKTYGSRSVKWRLCLLTSLDERSNECSSEIIIWFMDGENEWVGFNIPGPGSSSPDLSTAAVSARNS